MRFAPMNAAARGRLDRAGRILATVGALVVGALAVLFTLGAAWFISYFGDDSAARGLAAMVDVWPIWLLAVAVIAFVAVVLAWVIRGGAVALVLGAIVGLIITMAGLTMLATGRDDDLRWLVILAGTGGGVALASGVAARLAARWAAGSS
jgi:hypothetical protein